MTGKAPTDFNDLHQLAGLDAVNQQINAAIEQAQRSFKGVEDPPEENDSELFPEEHEQPPLEVYEGEGAKDLKKQPWFRGLDRTEGGVIKQHLANLETILLNDFRWNGVLAYCDFSYRIIMRQDPPLQSQAGEWTDADAARLRAWFHRSYRMQPPPRTEIVDAILIASQRHRFHPVREYLEKLRWDKKPRLLGWLRSAFDAADNRDYLAVVGEKFLIGAVARVMRPGCKMDNVLILEGEQGRGKSTAVAILFGDWFSDAPLPIGDKDGYQMIQGVWGAELAELDSFNKAETTAAKAFFSQRRDRYRPSYGHNAQDFPRQTIFIGTTNQDEYLKDYSGNRRYWPVKCRDVDTEWLTEHRDQLWAEAMVRFNDGQTWWVFDDAQRKLVEEQQDSRLQRDPWEDRLMEFLSTNTAQYFSSYILLTEAIALDAAHIQRAHQNRLAPIMKSLGWVKNRKLLPDPMKIDKKRQQWIYVRPKADDDDDPFPGEIA
ncbi:MAG: virulence-associated E family protein [Candidatus Thiodiazotropha sp. (ex Monitilora ramsayi)]|nr:virulence-associated E family protein [Candidatus Thiodiazotropha sp. (ex Monitilora ramsayi)]